jgi:hypothetical protein
MSRGRPHDSERVRRRKRQQLQALVIHHSVDGWHRWPLSGPTQGWVATRLLLSESGLRSALGRHGLVFEEMLNQARARVFAFMRDDARSSG